MTVVYPVHIPRVCNCSVLFVLPMQVSLGKMFSHIIGPYGFKKGSFSIVVVVIFDSGIFLFSAASAKKKKKKCSWFFFCFYSQAL